MARNVVIAALALSLLAGFILSCSAPVGNDPVDSPLYSESLNESIENLEGKTPEGQSTQNVSNQQRDKTMEWTCNCSTCNNVTCYAATCIGATCTGATCHGLTCSYGYYSGIHYVACQ